MALKFNNIKSLFIVDDEEDDNQKDNKDTLSSPVKKDTDTTKKTVPESKISWSTSSSKNEDTAFVNPPEEKPQEVEGQFNEQIFESLTKAVANSNLPGEDYLEFMQALKAMKNLPMDENLKVQAAFQTLSVKGLTVAKVIESADYYKSVLENEKRKFYTALEEQGKGSINKKKKIIADLEKQNQDKAAQIAALTEEINKNQARIEKNKKDIETAEGKLSQTEKNFLVTYKKVVGQINNNVAKIQQIPNLK